MTGANSPPVGTCAIDSSLRRCNACATSSAGVSPSVAIASMSPTSRPASAIAAVTDSVVSSRPPMPVLRPMREIPIPEMSARCSGTSTTGADPRSSPPSDPRPRHGRHATRARRVSPVEATDLTQRMLPTLTPENRHFWTGGAGGKLLILRCSTCGRWVHPPAPACPDDGSELRPEAVSGAGTVFTYTVNRHPYNPAVPPPYVIAIVELPEQ